MARSSWLLAMVAFLASLPVVAQTSPWAAIPENAIFETGDSWIAGGQRLRLYGVQACLRGTAFTNASGQRRDCGEASLAMLISLIRDYRPLCAPVLEGAPNGIRYVTCVAAPKGSQSAGSRIDLGTALIASGFAFAALQPDGKPIHLPYFVAELDAKRAKAGLWAFADLPEPGPIILKTLRAAQPAATGAPR
ncbi:MAG: thermonuclease family protein [Methylobacterium sp.]|jgi:endonuclease YncB( thermonuclease family)|nr:thermonuclease family protein [Methylobacterium sp.]MCA3653430.1 thermonuclease family protein [Methylobacterium sp.]